MPEPTTPRQSRRDDAGIGEHLRALTTALVAYVQARVQLAGIESKEALVHYVKIVILLAAGLLVAVFGYLFLCLGCVFAITRLFEDPHAWIWVALAVAMAHFLVTLICALVIHEMLPAPMFR